MYTRHGHSVTKCQILTNDAFNCHVAVRKWSPIDNIQAARLVSLFRNPSEASIAANLYSQGLFRAHLLPEEDGKLIFSAY